MSSSTTVTTEETDVNDGQTDLVERLENDMAWDYRPCPHKGCYGSLKVEDEYVICYVCHHTPDGEYVPPSSSDEGDNGVVEGRCSQYTFFKSNGHIEQRSTHSRTPNPWGRWGENRVPDDPDESYYNNSKKPRMFGGNWRVYSANEETRPNGVDEQYTFDLSTL